MYLDNVEMDELNKILINKDVIEDTIGCWKATRINGASASLACDGNISIPLIRAFDKLAAIVKTNAGVIDIAIARGLEHD